MSDKDIYTAYVLYTTDHYSQLIKHVFEYPIIEDWASLEAQQELRKYFAENHFSHEVPVYVECGDVYSIMPYVKRNDHSIPKPKPNTPPRFKRG